MNETKWKAFLLRANIKTQGDIRLATEAALFASLVENGVPKDLGVHGDDAGQFDVFVRSLCWIHEERHYRKFIAYNESTRQAIEQIREEIWDLYERLKKYKKSPSGSLKKRLENKFNTVFLKETCSPTLNKRLRSTYAKKRELLRVLERITTPLHNNGTETDAREMVIKRKVSGGTRSQEGKKCRDTFVSVKCTCRQLGISFLGYLQDRVDGLFNIPRLAQIISEIATRQPSGP